MEKSALAALQRRTLRVLIGAQVMGGAGFFLGFAVAVLLAKELTRSEALYGLPVAIAVAASALAAAPLGAWMERVGRRPGLAAGYLCAAAGSVGVLLAARADSFALFCLAMAPFGAANTSNLLARYAGGDLSDPSRRGRAISTILLATAAGAMLGPNLADVSGGLGDELGVPAKAAPFAVAAVALALAAAVNMILLRPDPLLTARQLGEADEGPVGGGASIEPAAAKPVAGALAERTPWPRMALTAVSALVLANLVMVAIMTVTPVHLDDAGQSLAVVGLVISLHVAGMFLPSPVSGVVVDRVGRIPVITASGVTLLLAGAIAATTSGHHAWPVIVALVLLGLGWNLGIVGGSALLTDSVPLKRRARAQGQADLAMGMAGAFGSLAAGPVLHAGGFGLLALGGGLVGAGLVVLALRARPFAPAPAGA